MKWRDWVMLVEREERSLPRMMRELSLLKSAITATPEAGYLIRDTFNFYQEWVAGYESRRAFHLKKIEESAP